jgi:hypothetical protein
MPTESHGETQIKSVTQKIGVKGAKTENKASKTANRYYLL